MDKEEMFSVLKHNIKSVLPIIDESTIHVEKTLKEIGANSIDRMEILTSTLETTGIHVALTELARAKKIKDIIKLLLDQKYGG